MEKILPISLKQNFTPNTLGCFGLTQRLVEAKMSFSPCTNLKTECVIGAINKTSGET